MVVPLLPVMEWHWRGHWQNALELGRGGIGIGAGTIAASTLALSLANGLAIGGANVIVFLDELPFVVLWATGHRH